MALEGFWFAPAAYGELDMGAELTSTLEATCSMQIYLNLNGENIGPFTLPRISAKLVSGEVPPDTLAWREGLDNWYPLAHEHWAEVGISATVAPAPVAQPEPEPQVEKVAEPVPETKGLAEPEPSAEESESTETSEEPSAEEPEPELDSLPEEEGSAFASYTEEDFKPPSLEDMDREMTSLRAEREPLIGLIGEKAFEAGIEDEEIEEAKEGVSAARQTGNKAAIDQAHGKLGQAVLTAGIHEDAIDDLRDRDRELSDRMLNLQMQARRMGGVSRAKKRKRWMKWIVILFALAVVGGAIALTVLFD